MYNYSTRETLCQGKKLWTRNLKKIHATEFPRLLRNLQ